MSDSKVLGQSKEQNTAQSKILSLCKDGSELLNQDDINGALKTFKKAFILSCNIPEGKLQKACLFNLGAAYICVGKPKKALKCLVKSRINGMEERDGDLYFNIGAAYDEMKEYGKAVRFYERAINEYGYEELKSIADALIKLGYCFVMIGDLSSAAHSFRLAGHSYMKNEKPEDAAMAMREAAKYMIDSQAFSQAEVLQTLNSCVESLKTISDEHLLGSLGDRSPQGQCLSNLAFAYSQLKNYDLAEFYYQQAHQAFVDAGDILRQCLVSEGLGATYFCLGNLDQAISHYKQALTLSGKSKETSNVIRERILEKLTDTIEYKVTHDRPAISTEKASRTRPDLSPSNCVNDACKSVTSQYHESWSPSTKAV
ncbi:hypothetical protein GDO81_009684 [Engystomops pustulosus]|uniref:Uncharacterized protein n=1 Tax=Engystomops pustulosus TaxID=76066 RepID=A0AAV7BU27_ENGPU|nr:hypothetical protein GDO81_009684 [Engystomops pustulosus]